MAAALAEGSAACSLSISAQPDRKVTCARAITRNTTRTECIEMPRRRKTRFPARPRFLRRNRVEVITLLLFGELTNDRLRRTVRHKDQQSRGSTEGSPGN